MGEQRNIKKSSSYLFREGAREMTYRFMTDHIPQWPPLEKMAVVEQIRAIQKRQKIDVEKCNNCKLFPCSKIKTMLKRTEEYRKICKGKCSEEDYSKLEKAFFEKEINLRK